MRLEHLALLALGRLRRLVLAALEILSCLNGDSHPAGGEDVCLSVVCCFEPNRGRCEVAQPVLGSVTLRRWSRLSERCLARLPLGSWRG